MFFVNSSNAFKGWMIMIVGGTAWGVTFSLAKIAMNAGAHPLGLTLWTSLTGGTMVLLYAMARRMRIPTDRRHLVFYLVCGLLGTAIPSTVFNYAVSEVPAGIVAIVVALAPMMSFAIAAGLGIDRIVAVRLLGVALGLLAVIMIVAPEASLPDPGMAPWVLLATAATSCYAIENNYIALRKPQETNAIVILCGMLIMAGFAIAPAVVATGTFVPLTSPFGTIELCIVALAAINVVSYGMFIHLISLTGPVFASQMAYPVTFTGVFWGIVIFGEQHSPWIWAALVVMLSGLALVKPLSAKDPLQEGCSP